MDLYKVRHELGSGKSIYDLNIRVTFYARVSTDKDIQLNSLDNQITYFKDLIAKNKNWEYVDGYIDEGISGTSINKRTQFIKMINDGKLKKFDLVLTKEISRFARDTLDSIKYTREFLENGIGIIFLSDNINTLMPDSELRLTIMASIAQEEVRKLSERVKFGMKRSIEKGNVLGNSAITGYKKQNGKLVIIPREAEMIRLIYEWYTTREIGLEKIAKELYTKGFTTQKNGIIHTTTIRRIITNPKYKGFYCTNTVKRLDYKTKKQIRLPKNEWIIYDSKGTIPAIVSEEMWNQANILLEKRRSNYLCNIDDDKAFCKRYVYSGLLFCSQHPHSSFRRITNASKNAFWVCSNYQKYGVKCCKSPRLPEQKLNKLFKELLNLELIDKNEIVKTLITIYEKTTNASNYEKELKNIQTKIDEIKIKKDKILDLCIRKIISEEDFRNKKQELDLQITKNKEELQRTKDNLVKEKVIISQINKLKKTILKEINSMDLFKEKINLLVNKITIYKIENNRNKIKLEVKLNLFSQIKNLYISK